MTIRETVIIINPMSLIVIVTQTFFSLTDTVYLMCFASDAIKCYCITTIILECVIITILTQLRFYFLFGIPLLFFSSFASLCILKQYDFGFNAIKLVIILPSHSSLKQPSFFLFVLS